MILIIRSETEFWIQKDFDEVDVQLADNGIHTMINLESKEFYVAGDVWQKILEK